MFEAAGWSQSTHSQKAKKMDICAHLLTATVGNPKVCGGGPFSWTGERIEESYKNCVCACVSVPVCVCQCVTPQN